MAAIGPGMLVLLGVGREDSREQAEKIATRLLRLRIFEDGEGRMNDPVGEREVLCVSQFTLYGDTRRGNRPGWGAAASSDQARPLYQLVCDRLGAARGVFGARMEVELVNDGPVTVSLET